MVKLYEFFPQKLKEDILEQKIAEDKNSSKSNKIKLKLDSEFFAYPRLRKLPLASRKNVLSAMNYFDKVSGITEEECALAFVKIIKAADSFELCTMGFKDRNSKYNCIS